MDYYLGTLILLAISYNIQKTGLQSLILFGITNDKCSRYNFEAYEIEIEIEIKAK